MSEREAARLIGARAKGLFERQEQFDADSKRLITHVATLRASRGAAHAAAHDAPADEEWEPVRAVFMSQLDSFEAAMRSFHETDLAAWQASNLGVDPPTFFHGRFGHPLSSESPLARLALWPEHKTDWFLTYPVAKVVETAPMGAMRAERINSGKCTSPCSVCIDIVLYAGAGGIVTKVRGSMTPDRVETCVILKSVVEDLIRDVYTGLPSGEKDWAEKLYYNGDDDADDAEDAAQE